MKLPGVQSKRSSVVLLQMTYSSASAADPAAIARNPIRNARPRRPIAKVAPSVSRSNTLWQDGPRGRLYPEKVITRRELERWLLREGAVRVKRADGHKHFTLRGRHVVVLGHGPQTLSATSVSLVMKQLEQAGYSREQLRREWGRE